MLEKWLETKPMDEVNSLIQVRMDMWDEDDVPVKVPSVFDDDYEKQIYPNIKTEE